MSYRKKNVLAALTAMVAVLLPSMLFAQDGPGAKGTPVQVVKGTIVNAQTRRPVSGASIALVGTKLGAISRPDGSYRIANVPVGRHTLRITTVGYEPTTINIVVTSGRQVVEDVALQESVVRAAEIVVSGNDPLRAVNETALVSANAFTVDDVTRYAGGHGDPARMAQNFAGVLGNDIFRNDIVIRGGSPSELLWRLDGIDIPNPNHFATQGSTGGPINTINANLLANSNFLTGAFPAEYGDRLSGVFDLRTRRGNAEQYEFVAQMGMNGFEGMAEGPIPGVSGGSFVASYRRSTLQVFDAFGIDLGIDAVPRYQDAMVKIDLPIGTADNISLTALGGLSAVDVAADREGTLVSGDVDVTEGTDLGVVGIVWQRLFSEYVVGNLSINTVNSLYRRSIDSLTVGENRQVVAVTPWSRMSNIEEYTGARYTLSYAPNPSHYFTVGIEGRLLGYDLNQRRLTVRTESTPVVVEDAGQTGRGLAFLSWNWRPTEELTLTTGVHAQYLDVSDKSSIEPRLSFSYALTSTQSVSAGFGTHRQAQPLLTYFGAPDNRTLDFTQSNHYILGYTLQPAADWLLKLEGYYKAISDAPVERDSATSYSLLNGGNGGNRTLVNDGKGRNYGAELTLTKHFTDGYYVTVTGSYVRQEYTGSDGVWRNGAFDNKYIANVLAGYEWIVSSAFTIEFSGKYTIAGGAPYTPIDLEQSRRYNDTYTDPGRRFSERDRDYSRLDLRTDFRNNFGSWAMIGYISVQNVLDRKNIESRQYNPLSDKAEEVNQIGIFPVAGIRFEF